MISEMGYFFLALGLGFSFVQTLASFWGVARNNLKYLKLGQIAAFLQGGAVSASFLTLVTAFLACDFSILTVALHDHTHLPWIYRIAATWGNHEGSLLLFILILSSIGVLQASFLQPSLFRGRTLTFQGLLIVFFLIFLIMTSNPFKSLPFSLSEGSSLNPLLQDRGLLFHPPLLYLGYVGFSASFSLALAALWGKENVKSWNLIVRPWVLFAWGALTAGITLGSWWAYYELGWGGWWFWDPVENASFMPWLAGTALLHTLRTTKLYRFSLFLSVLTFDLSLLGTFLVRSGLITSVHSFAQDPERGYFILCLLGGTIGVSLFMWIWKAPGLQNFSLVFSSRHRTLLFNAAFLCAGLATVILGTLYPLWSDWIWQIKVAVGAPYFERTLVPLMVPFLICIPIGSLLRDENESLFPLLITPLTATLGVSVVLLYVFNPLSLWAFMGIGVGIWVLGGVAIAFSQKRLPLGPTLAHLGVAISLLGVSVAAGFRTDESCILGLKESLRVDETQFTLQDVRHGKGPTYLYEKAILTSPQGNLTPEKRFYQPQNSLLNETAILTNGLKDIYAILGPYQGENRWLIRVSSIPLAPWIWAGGIFMVLGAFFSFLNHRQILAFLFLFLPTLSFAGETIKERASALYKEVRCPVCAAQSIEESEDPESKALKGFILEQLKEGKSDEMIRDEIRSLFGDDILFHPPFRGKSLLLWLAPFALFLLLLTGLLWKGYRTRK